MDYLIEIIGGLIFTLLSWMGIGMRDMKNRIKELEEGKVDKDVYQELKAEIHSMSVTLTEMRMEQAEWRGKQASQNKR